MEVFRTQVGFEHHQAGSAQVNWKPWDSILRMLAEDEKFWGEELKDKAIAWQMRPRLVQHVTPQLPDGQRRGNNARSTKRQHTPHTDGFRQ